MSKPTKVRANIFTREGKRSFFFLVHHRTRKEDLSFDHDKFYLMCGSKKEMVFPHYEIQLITPEFSGSSDTMHYRSSDDGKGRILICWPHRIPTKEAAARVIEGWTAAAVHAMETNTNSETMIVKYCGKDPVGNFLAGLREGMERDHGIRVELG